MPHLKGPSLKALFDVTGRGTKSNSEGCCSEQPVQSGVVDVSGHVIGWGVNLKLVVVFFFFSNLFLTTECQEPSSYV